MEYLGVGEPVVNSPSADKGIITLAINLNLNYYMKNIENRTLYHASKKRKVYWEIFMCQRKEKDLINTWKQNKNKNRKQNKTKEKLLIIYVMCQVVIET